MPEIGRSSEEAIATALFVPPAQGPSMRGVPFARRDPVRIGFVSLEIFPPEE